jgi:hypothetical protein
MAVALVGCMTETEELQSEQQDVQDAQQDVAAEQAEAKAVLTRLLKVRKKSGRRRRMWWKRKPMSSANARMTPIHNHCAQLLAGPETALQALQSRFVLIVFTRW